MSIESHRKILIAFILVVAILGLSVGQDTWAACHPNRRASNVDRPFYAFATYIDFDDITADPSHFVGRFWQTDSPAGGNEGTYSVTQWLHSYEGYDQYWYFVIDTGTVGVSGCPTGCMTLYLEDRYSDRFILWTRDQGAKLTPGNDFDFTNAIPGGEFNSFQAVPSPRPRITRVTRTGDMATVEFEVLNPTDGIVIDTTDCGVEGNVTGINVYLREGAQEPSGDISSGWIEVATLGSLGGTRSVEADCSLEEQWLATGLEVSGVHPRFVGEPVPVCACMDLDGDSYPGCDTDCDDSDPDIYPGAPQICDGKNNDCRHPIWPVLNNLEDFDDDGDGLAECFGDCNDSNPDVYPGAPEICDGFNNDCDHPDWPNPATPEERDDDGDSLSECVGDCDDTNGQTYPGAPQICDGLNNDCDDPNWPDPPALDEFDDDGDLFSECQGDCDDSTASVFPGAPQICDGLNNNRDDPAWPDLTGSEVDDDGDLFSECDGDCADDNGSIYPAAPELCDGIANDCDNPEWPSIPPTEANEDGDSFMVCEGDCDDMNSAVYPGSPQQCDGLNNDCDDPDWPVVPESEADADSDLFRVCENDCDDLNPAVNPGSTETCNGLDDDCNNLIDEDVNGEDTDSDGIHNLCDNCWEYYNASQLDADGDDRGDVCDNCWLVSNPGQQDTDSDNLGNACDNCPLDYNPTQADYDTDMVGDVCDNCYFDFNPTQADTDEDWEGDRCDLDDGMIYVFFNHPNWVEWQVEVGFEFWNCYKGDLGVLVSSCEVGNCHYTQVPGSNESARQDCNLIEPWFEDLGFPSIGKTAYYIISGVSGGVEGHLGQDSSGTVRPNENPCP